MQGPLQLREQHYECHPAFAFTAAFKLNGDSELTWTSTTIAINSPNPKPNNKTKPRNAYKSIQRKEGNFPSFPPLNFLLTKDFGTR